ncbi:hypothetical protein J7443_21130 [Tropicibacter sp. R15_0]|uniref:hypothetical protein n=1 Tax=Tropicibacter sp. R15_0 TaxID=2821101 RepID=UPI001ADD4E92|nr:hypothetical protein [Tropicibacter sp. R15_0]MBO9467748.1 hypothetical protein [Tropicibacter sp. R15_0]
MQPTGPSLWIAPLATGHPHGLPGAKRPEKPTTKVQPLDQARNPDAALTRGQTPGNFWKAVNGEPIPEEHIAPPSIMQLKISQILDEQAQELEATTPAMAERMEAEHADAREKTPSELPDLRPTGKPVELETSQGLPVAEGPSRDPDPAMDTPAPTLPAYEEAASFSRSEVLSTLP